MTEPQVPETVALTDWWLFRRVQEVEAAGRVNLVRAAAVTLFAVAHWIQWLSLKQAPSKAEMAWHNSVTPLVIAGLALSAGVFLALRLRLYPPLGKYLTTVGDLALVTGVGLAGEKAASGIVVAYLLVIAMTYLRFSLRLVSTATAGSLIGYLALVGAADPIWFDANHVTPVERQLVTLFTIVLSGVVGGFICSMAKSWFETQEALRQTRIAAGPQRAEGDLP